MLTGKEQEYLDYIINVWKSHRNDKAYKSVIPVNIYLFPYVADGLSDCDDIAYISIICTKDCAAYNDFDDDVHYLKTSDNVLNLEFDDVTEEAKLNGYTFMPITDDQAEILFDFIEKNKGKHFIVHCRAGISRSQAVVRFIFDKFQNIYGKDEVNEYNRCIVPNMEVLKKLNNAYMKRRNLIDR